MSQLFLVDAAPSPDLFVLSSIVVIALLIMAFFTIASIVVAIVLTIKVVRKNKADIIASQQPYQAETVTNQAAGNDNHFTNPPAAPPGY
jgi:hypothetical protein